MKECLLFCLTLLVISCNDSTYYSPVVSQVGSYEGVDPNTYTLAPYSADGSIQHATTADAEGRVLEEGTLFNGVKDGTWITYDYKFNREAVSTVKNYKDGVQHGPYFILESGQLKEKGTYYEGMKDGLIKTYNRGQLNEELNFKADQLHGMVKRYYDDGTPKEEGEFQNGQREGVHKWYDQEGNVKIEYTYKNGKKVD